MPQLNKSIIILDEWNAKVKHTTWQAVKLVETFLTRNGYFCLSKNQ